MRTLLIAGALGASALLLILGGFTEQTAAQVMGVGLLGGAVWLSALPTLEQVVGRVRVALVAFVLLWVGASAYPLWKLVRPGDPVRTVSMSEEGAEVDLGKLPAGRYLLVAEVPRDSLVSDLRYGLSVRNGGRWQELAGEFTRTAFRARAGRKRRGVSESVHSADYHDVVLDGGPARIRLDSTGGSEKAIQVEIHAHAASHGLWLGLQAGLLLLGAAIGGLLPDEKRKSSLATGAAFTLAFVEGVRASIRPDRLWKPILGSAAAAILGAMLAGVILDWIARRLALAARGRPRSSAVP